MASAAVFPPLMSATAQARTAPQRITRENIDSLSPDKLATY
jgi:hypothetical protein